MDKVEYVSASGTFAIVRKGTPEKANPEKELQALLDMRPDKQVFVEKQLPKFLARYGRQFECSEPVSVARNSEDARRLEELGYVYLSGQTTLSSDKLGLSKPGERASFEVTYGREGMATLFPSMEVLSGACDRYVVDLTDNKDPKSLLGTIETARYVAGLGLVSQGYASHEVKLRPKLRPLSALYELTPPPSLRLDLDPTGNDESAEGEPLLWGATGSAVYDEKGGPTGASLLEFDDEEGRRWWLIVPMKRFIECDANGNQKPAHPWVRTLPDGSPDEGDLNRLAASLLLSIVEERYRDKPCGYVVDPATLRLRKSGAPYLVGELVRCIVAGKVHPCDRCGRPIMGGASYCRSGRCQQATLEAARREAARGRSVDEILAIYPHIKRATVEGYVEDERRGL
ncbi:hypothetical protein [Parafannyhessea umbonata]|uniref:Uncharacterized protein n=1 Tax=Parafannyhessea umbonata TaxID=604330 RepID=A0A1G6M0R7_9ACTN|nr:hypothetical protein [Parafannyhessea umbonata]SDC48585.1 hypothetical protein SAMN04487824_11738 [Parafannyhessea umbonata]